MARKTTAVAVVDGGAVVASGEREFTKDQVELIKSTVAQGATDDELALYLHQAGRSGLDPLSRQIYFIKRNSWDAASKSYVEKGTIQVAIDGFRLIADRTGDYAPGREPTFSYKADKLFSCTSYVKKRTRDWVWHEVSATAHWREYVQLKGDKKTPTKMWFQMPHAMIAKCAEALALRKAFPANLSGMYTNDEMMQAGEGLPAPSGAVGGTTQAELEAAQQQVDMAVEAFDAEVVEETPPESVQYVPPAPPAPAPAAAPPAPPAPAPPTEAMPHGEKTDEEMLAFYQEMDLDIKGNPLNSASEGQRRLVWGRTKGAGMTKDEVNALAFSVLGKTTSNMWTNGDVSYFLWFVENPERLVAQRAIWEAIRTTGTSGATTPAAANPPPAAAPVDEDLPF